MARSVHMATVRQPLHEMGRRAVEVPARHIEARRRGEAYPGPFNIDLPTEIVSGETLAKPGRTRLTIAGEVRARPSPYFTDDARLGVFLDKVDSSIELLLVR